MLIITADDYGKNPQATDNILKCIVYNRITSASAMVFMADSDRAASCASGIGLEIGLHLNYTAPFTARNTPIKLREYQNKLYSYLAAHKLSQIIYNPLLTNVFGYVFFSQKEEFLRLYSKPPDFFNGHHHMHLCANMLLDNWLPKGSRIRGPFTFEREEKGAFNRLYRRVLRFHISKRFISTDSFFSIEPINNHKRLRNIVKRAALENVEIEVHPESNEEFCFLLEDQFQNLIKSIQVGNFLSLPAKWLLR